MKLKMITVVSVLAALGLFAGSAHASSVSVTNSTTTIVGSSSGRARLLLYNNSATPVYYEKATSSTTVGAGMILPSSTTVVLEGYKGTVYGITATGTADVRYFSVAR